MPYSHNVFSFQDKGTLNCLFLKKLRAIQKRSVREIAVEWKPTSAAQVKDLTGLKTVYYFEDPYFTKWRELRIWERGWGSGGMDWENVVKDVKVINAGEFDWDCKESPFWEEFVWDGIEVGDVDETLRPRLGP